MVFTGTYLDPRANVQVIAGISYLDYLKTRHWQTVRHFAMEFYDWKCQDCGKRSQSRNRYGSKYGRTHNVHHLNYACLWKERPSDVVVLCRTCHEKRHSA